MQLGDSGIHGPMPVLGFFEKPHPAGRTNANQTVFFNFKLPKPFFHRKWGAGIFSNFVRCFSRDVDMWPQLNHRSRHLNMKIQPHMPHGRSFGEVVGIEVDTWRCVNEFSTETHVFIRLDVLFFCLCAKRDLLICGKVYWRTRAGGGRRFNVCQVGMVILPIWRVSFLFFSKLVNLVDWLVGLSVGVEIWDTFEKDSFGILWESLVGQRPQPSHHLPIPGAILKSPKTCSMSIHARCVSKWRWRRWIFRGPTGARWTLVASPVPRNLSPQRRSFWKRMRVSK